MKCRYCGYDIPEGELYCGNCKREAIVVPDYSPLDDMLTAHIRLGINGEGEEGPDALREIARPTGQTARQTGQTARRPGSHTRTSSAGRNTSGKRRRTGEIRMEDERRRRQAARKRELKRRKRRKILALLAGLFVLFAAAGLFLYWNSYGGIVRRGQGALGKGDYKEAEELFQKAVGKDASRPEAYTGLAGLYVAQGEPEEADEMFAALLDKQPGNVDIYEAYIQFCLDADRPMEIPAFLDEAKSSIRKALSSYIIRTPEFDLDDDETFEDVQQVSLSAQKGMTIRYTTDGSDPSPDSRAYKEPIQLGEGETVVKAIAVDKRGVPSMTAAKHYVVEFPIEDAPAVSPSTGQYESAQQIEIKVPDGYEAYYTMDGNDPTTASKKYTGPIEMPEGSTLFKAILVSSGGRQSGVTTRNYMLDEE